MLQSRCPHSSSFHFCTGLPGLFPEDLGQGLISDSSSFPTSPGQPPSALGVHSLEQSYCEPTWAAHTVLPHDPDSPLSAIPCNIPFESLFHWAAASPPSVLVHKCPQHLPLLHALSLLRKQSLPPALGLFPWGPGCTLALMNTSEFRPRCSFLRVCNTCLIYASPCHLTIVIIAPNNCNYIVNCISCLMPIFFARKELQGAQEASVLFIAALCTQ